MKSLPYSDTNPDVEKLLMSMLRDLPAWRKFVMVGELNATVRQLATAGIRDRYPEATEKEVSRRLADILLGPELAEKVYGLLPLTD